MTRLFNEGGGFLLAIGFIAAMIINVVYAMRNGSRLQPLTRRGYIYRLIALHALALGIEIAVLLTTAVTYPALITACWMPGALLWHYFLVRYSVQRLCDIDGAPYRGFIRAFLSPYFLVTIYLCLYPGKGTLATDIEMF